MAVNKINAPYVNDRLDDHLTKHEDVYWPLVQKHEKLLLGEGGDNGLCAEVKEIMKGFKTIERLGYAVIAMIVLDLVSRIMSLPK